MLSKSIKYLVVSVIAFIMSINVPLFAELTVADVLPTMTFVNQIQVDGIYYDIYDNGEAYISLKIVNDPWGNPTWSSIGSNEVNGDVIIPSYVNYQGTNYPVCGMRESSFQGENTITSITLPSTMRYIQNYAFSNCSSLTTVNIPDSVTFIGIEAFSNCDNLTNVIVPSSVRSILDRAFLDCDNLSITLPAGVNVLSGTFDRCDNLVISYPCNSSYDTNSWGLSATAKIQLIHGESDSSGNCSLCGTAIVGIDMYRLYNPNSGEHFYTGIAPERDFLIGQGWTYEGVAWTAPRCGDPVYRVYNQYAGDHHYTTNYQEVQFLVSQGWTYEGIGWYSADNTGSPLYRLYNRNCTGAGSHHYTTVSRERDDLTGLGWIYEGIGWYGI